MKKSYLTILVALFASALVLMSFSLPQDKEYGPKWDIPDKYQKMENPYKEDKGLERVGKGLYMKHCRSCHGNTAAGDGAKSRMMSVKIHDLSSEDVQSHNDGELYYMSIIGREDMPNFEGKIPDKEDRWAIVNYIRSIKK
jgi:mono/diheme cytochrome c family protein